METKQVIVMRKDLGMRKGKMIAQGAHASLAVIFDECDMKNAMLEGDSSPLFIPNYVRLWLEDSFTKVVVSVNSEEELLEVYAKAKKAHIPCALITDAGRTEFGWVPTNTCIGIGPYFCEDIDKITGDLKLL